MHERYSAPMANDVWSQQSRINRLRWITEAYALKKAEKDGMGMLLAKGLALIEGPTPDEWKKAEEEHGHEVVGFLDAYLRYVPSPLHQYFHFGLTSSDLTEFDLHQAVMEHATSMGNLLHMLQGELMNKRDKYECMPRAGRTHGQTAELTFLGHQFGVHVHVFGRIIGDIHSLKRKGTVTKTPGPTGWSQYWNENEVTSLNHVPSTQIVPRDHLMEWMMVYQRAVLALENLALFVRCGARSEIGEFAEGKERQGSSAMPGKHNPIDSEKVCGLARVARGYFLALMESYSLWEDRDLSNSSAERISVYGLASLVEHMTDTMVDVMANLQVDSTRVVQNSQHPRTRMSQLQMDKQETGVGPIKASELVKLEGPK